MTGLRTIWGVSKDYLKDNFGYKFEKHFTEKWEKYFDSNHLIQNNNIVTTTINGKFLSDRIASDLFIINSKS